MLSILVILAFLIASPRLLNVQCTKISADFNRKNLFFSQSSSILLTSSSSSTIDLTATDTCIFPSTQLQALEDLYYQTDGEQWRWRFSIGTEWNFTEPDPNPCAENWAGISCSTLTIGRPCNVTKLYLDDFGLRGYLPNTLNLLSTLTELDLGNNYLRGTIPSSITELTELYSLAMASNSFNGTIPLTIGQLKKLRILDLTQNDLNGVLPHSMSELTKLQYMNISLNNITDHIPSFLGNLTDLEVLDLSVNSFFGTIPSSLSNLKRLIVLKLNKNILDGRLPPDLGNLPIIDTMDFTNNSLTGSIPLSYGNLTTITHFSVSNNYMFGEFSDSIVRHWKHMRVLNLNNNRFNGTIPPSIIHLINMTELSFSTNTFTGPLPSEITNLHLLEFLYLSNNFLSGTLPPDFTKFSRIKEFELYHNNFTGTISPTLGNMTDVEVIDLGHNYLRGSLPETICNLIKIKFFFVNLNYLTGSIPQCIGKLTEVNELLFQNNYLIGSMPMNITLLHKLRYLYVYGNKMTGKLPDNFGENYPFMTQLDLHENFFSGTLPLTVCNMIHMRFCYFSNNLFVGQLPLCFGQINTMEQLFLQYNYFTGSIPQSFGNFTLLNTLMIDMNRLTGTVPSEIYKHGESMIALLLCNNYLTGTLDDSIGTMNHLGIFNISNNSFSGSLPKSMSNLFQMTSLDLSSNNFQSSIPTGVLSSLPYLKILFIENNRFTGPLSTIFDFTYQFKLTDIDVSNNYFTSTLPSDLFKVNRQLATFAAVKNCITGSIPESICDNKLTRSLALDGLHTAEHCQDKIFPMLKSVDTYQLTKDINGGIPTCLYSMPLLKTLHLSGNGIRGSLPSSVTFGQHLNDVSLSHNLLKGSIPTAFQERSFYNFDLSFNQISGSLLDTFAQYSIGNASLKLQVNRLSGALPTSILNLHNISILQGNIFSCINGDNSLPEHDQYMSSYSCGSDSVNQAIYLWIAGFIAFIIAMIIYFNYLKQYLQKKFIKVMEHFAACWAVFDDPKVLYDHSAAVENGRSSTVMKLRSSMLIGASRLTLGMSGGISGLNRKTESGESESESDLHSESSYMIVRGSFLTQIFSVIHSSLFNTSGLNMTIKSKTKDGKINYIYRFGLLLGRMRKVAAHIVAMMLFVLMPIYIVLNQLYSMYNYPYAWQIGFAFLSGTIPAIVLLIIFLFFYCRIYYFLKLWLLDSYIEEVLIGRLKKEKSTNPNVTSSGRTISSMLYRSFTRSTATNNVTEKLKEDLEKEKEQQNEKEKQKEKEKENNDVNDKKSQPTSSQESDGTFKRNLLRQQKIQQDISNAKIGFYLRELLILLFNCSIVLGVNMGYVYATTLNISKNAITFLVFLVSLFKIVWGNFMVVQIFSSFLLSPYEPSNYSSNVSKSTSSSGSNSSYLFNTQQDVLIHFTSLSLKFLVYLAIFNNVIAPSLAAMIVSPDCFFYMIVDSPSVTVSYEFIHCIEFYSTTVSNSCKEYGYNTHTTSYSPPYSYGFKCSSALITNFSDIFIYRYLFTGLITPLFLIVCKYCQEYCYQYYYNKNKIYRVMFKILSTCLPVIARPVANTTLVYDGDRVDGGGGGGRRGDRDRDEESVRPSDNGMNDYERGRGGGGGEQMRRGIPNPLLMSFGNNTASMFVPPGGERPTVGVWGGGGTTASGDTETGGTTTTGAVNWVPSPSLIAAGGYHNGSDRDTNDRNTLIKYSESNSLKLQPNRGEGVNGKQLSPYQESTNYIIRPTNAGLRTTLIQSDSDDNSDSPSLSGGRDEYRKTIQVDRMLNNKQLCKQLFNKDMFTIGFVSDIAVLMTYGIIFPPLGLVIFCNIIINTFIIQIMIGRFIFLSKSIQQRSYLLPLVDYVNEECKDVGRWIFDSLPTIAILTCVFWSFGLFDTLADSIGTNESLWVLFIVALLPCWIYGIETMYNCGKESLEMYLRLEEGVDGGGRGRGGGGGETGGTGDERDNDNDDELFRASGFTDSSVRHSIFSRPSYLLPSGSASMSMKEREGTMSSIRTSVSQNQSISVRGSTSVSQSVSASVKSVSMQQQGGSSRPSIATSTKATIMPVGANVSVRMNVNNSNKERNEDNYDEEKDSRLTCSDRKDDDGIELRLSSY